MLPLEMPKKGKSRLPPKHVFYPPFLFVYMLSNRAILFWDPTPVSRCLFESWYFFTMGTPYPGYLTYPRCSMFMWTGPKTQTKRLEYVSNDHSSFVNVRPKPGPVRNHAQVVSATPKPPRAPTPTSGCAQRTRHEHSIGTVQTVSFMRPN